MTDLDLTYHSTPALWIATKKDACYCQDCVGKQPFGMGKTKEAAVKALQEYEDEQADGR
jgi:hypothetical protein